MRMLLLSTLFILLNGVQAFAGDGGFELYTCISGSGRTNLTVVEDYYSETRWPLKVVLGVDGDFETYAQEYIYDENSNRVPVNCNGECLEIIKTSDNENVVTVKKGDQILLMARLDKSGMLYKGFVDPRRGYDNELNPNDIALNCKRFEGQP